MKFTTQECTKYHLRIHKLFVEYHRYYTDLFEMVRIRNEAEKTFGLEDPARWLVRNDSCFMEEDDFTSSPLYFDLYLLSDRRHTSKFCYHFDSEAEGDSSVSLSKNIVNPKSYLHTLIETIYTEQIVSVSFYQFKTYPMLIALKK